MINNNFNNVANYAQVPRSTVREYFQILIDTPVLHELPAWKQSRARRAITASLQGRAGVAPGTREFGDALAYWRAASGFEEDFLIGDHTAVEVKATAHVSAHDLRSLKAPADERVFKRLVCVCLESRQRRVGDIHVLPLRAFLEQLWGGRIR